MNEILKVDWKLQYQKAKDLARPSVQGEKGILVLCALIFLWWLLPGLMVILLFLGRAALTVAILLLGYKILLGLQK